MIRCFQMLSGDVVFRRVDVLICGMEYMRKRQKMKWKDVKKVVKTMEGKQPESEPAVRNVMDISGARGLAECWTVCSKSLC